MALTKVTGQVINTSTDVTVGVLTVTNTLAVGGTVSIGGTLTYEDVTNIDSVGLITARNGIVVGSGITLSKDGDVFFTGIATGNGSGLTNLPSAQLTGALPAIDGSNLTGIAADKIFEGNTEAEVVDTGSDGHFKVTTEGSERLRIIADGKVGVNKTAPNFHFDVAGNIGLTEGQVITWHDGSGTKAGDMYIDSSDNFVIRNTSSATERFRVASTGNVGIGDRTTTPDQLLHIHTSSGEAIAHIEAATNARVRVRAHSGESIVQFADADSSNPGEINYSHSSDTMSFRTNGGVRMLINANGHLLPNADNTYDLGSNSARWRDIFTNDLQLSNEGGKNDVDGTWGNYTIQEGESDLFLINNRSGKKYKFNLTEVS